MRWPKRLAQLQLRLSSPIAWSPVFSLFMTWLRLLFSRILSLNTWREGTTFGEEMLVIDCILHRGWCRRGRARYGSFCTLFFFRVLTSLGTNRSAPWLCLTVASTTRSRRGLYLPYWFEYLDLYSLSQRACQIIGQMLAHIASG